jgi:hypothetical protein
MLVSNSHQVGKYVGGFAQKIHRVFLKNAYCFCYLAKLFKESDRAPSPIVRLSRINFLEHILPLIECYRALLLVIII